MDGGFLEADERRQRRKKLFFYIVAVLIAWTIVGGAMYAYWVKYGTNSEDRFDREMVADPVMSIALEPLQRLFPYEYARLRRASAEDYNVDRHGRVIDHMPGDFLRHFRQRHAYEALMGGNGEKVSFIAAQGALYDAAVKDPKLCHMLAGNEDQMSDMTLVLSNPSYAKYFASYVAVAASGVKNHEPDKSDASKDMADYDRALRKIDPKLAPVDPDDENAVCKERQRNSLAIRTLLPEQQARMASRAFQIWR